MELRRIENGSSITPKKKRKGIAIPRVKEWSGGPMNRERECHYKKYRRSVAPPGRKWGNEITTNRKRERYKQKYSERGAFQAERIRFAALCKEFVLLWDIALQTRSTMTIGAMMWEWASFKASKMSALLHTGGTILLIKETVGLNMHGWQ